MFSFSLRRYLLYRDSYRYVIQYLQIDLLFLLLLCFLSYFLFSSMCMVSSLWSSSLCLLLMHLTLFSIPASCYLSYSLLLPLRSWLNVIEKMFHSSHFQVPSMNTFLFSASSFLRLCGRCRIEMPH